MALIACPECGSEVSDLAVHCSTCGWRTAPGLASPPSEQRLPDVKCPKCNTLVSYTVTICPYCGYKRGSSNYEKIEDQSSLLGIGAGALVLILGMVWLVSSHSCSGTPESGDRGDPIEAFVMSQEFVKRSLKSPSTADFPWFDNSFVKTLGKGRYRVSAYVDAQNSFGAELRSDYTCVLSTENGDSWALESLDIR